MEKERCVLISLHQKTKQIATDNILARYTDYRTSHKISESDDDIRRQPQNITENIMTLVF